MKMQPIATDVALSAGYDREPHKMDEPIKMLFGVLTQADPRNHALGEVQVPQGQFWEGTPIQCSLSS